MIATVNRRPGLTEEHGSFRERRRFRLQIFDAADRSVFHALDADWKMLLAEQLHLTSIFQTPEFLRFRLLRHPDVRHRIAVVSAADGTIAGIVPIAVRNYPIEFSVLGRRLASVVMRCAHPLGGHLLMPQDESLYERLFVELLRNLADCDAILLDYLRPEAQLWDMLTLSHGLLRRNWIIHFPEGARELNTIALTGDFDAYLRKFSGKTRNSLRRKVRQMSEYGRGELTLQRFDTEETASEYLQRAAQISHHSWQYQKHGTQIPTTIAEQEATRELAREGFFRSYILRCGGEDLAFCSGWQYGRTYCYVKPAFDGKAARLSPGTVLLYLMIEDLCRVRPASCINLLQNDNPYKRMFGTHTGFDASVLIAPRRPRNVGVLNIHRASRAVVRYGKDLLGRPRVREYWEACATRTMDVE
jgi:CelD/BcsL family acetyltransferase involved in cellulose biosynthesis